MVDEDFDTVAEEDRLLTAAATDLERGALALALADGWASVGKLDVARAVLERALDQIAVVEAEAEDIRKFLGENGMRVTRPNQKSFINAVLPMQDKFVAERGAEFKTMLDKFRAAVA